MAVQLQTETQNIFFAQCLYILHIIYLSHDKMYRLKNRMKHRNSLAYFLLSLCDLHVVSYKCPIKMHLNENKIIIRRMLTTFRDFIQFLPHLHMNVLSERKQAEKNKKIGRRCRC